MGVSFMNSIRIYIRCTLKQKHKPHNGAQWSGARYIGVCRYCERPIERQKGQKWNLFNPDGLLSVIERKDQITEYVLTDMDVLASNREMSPPETAPGARNSNVASVEEITRELNRRLAG